MSTDTMARWSVILGITIPVLNTITFSMLIGPQSGSGFAQAVLAVSALGSLSGFFLGLIATVRSNVQRKVSITGAVMNLVFLVGYAVYVLAGSDPVAGL